MSILEAKAAGWEAVFGGQAARGGWERENGKQRGVACQEACPLILGVHHLLSIPSTPKKPWLVHASRKAPKMWDAASPEGWIGGAPLTPLLGWR